MAAYYNEFNREAAAWLRVLISEGLIAHGYVDERSIEEVTAADLRGFTQCHFFAGIGGWSLALRIAGITDDTPCWTGSPPCQPFSLSGKLLGFDDPRHLAPTFLRLIDQCRPARLFGEQVAAAIKPGWLDFVFSELEGSGYACGAAVLPAGAVEAPHKRDRLFFGATRNVADAGHEQPAIAGSGRDCGMVPGRREQAAEAFAGRGGAGELGNADRERCEGERLQHQRRGSHSKTAGASETGKLADSEREGSQGWLRGWENSQRQAVHGHAGSGRAAGDLADAFNRSRLGREPGPAVWQHAAAAGAVQADNPWQNLKQLWAGCDWILCRDGNYRPIEPGTVPLANGVPARVGRLRGYGNAITPQVAAEFVEAFNEACEDARRS